MSKQVIKLSDNAAQRIEKIMSALFISSEKLEVISILHNFTLFIVFLDLFFDR